MPKLNLSLIVWVANETSFDATSEMLDQKLNAKPEFWFTQQKKGEWERMNRSQSENKRKSTWVLICIKLLCLPVTSFFYVTSLKIQHLNWIHLPANQDIISRECCCQYGSGGVAGFTLWSNKVQRDRDPGGSIKALGKFKFKRMINMHYTLNKAKWGCRGSWRRGISKCQGKSTWGHQ